MIRDKQGLKVMKSILALAENVQAKIDLYIWFGDHMRQTGHLLVTISLIADSNPARTASR